MQGIEFQRVKFTLAGAVAIAVLAFGATACGSSGDSSTSTSGGSTAAPASTGSASTPSSSGSDGEAMAKAAVEKSKQVPSFSLQAPAVDAAKAKGMSIFSVPISSANPFNTAVDKQMEALAQKLGIKWTEYANQGNPTQWAAGINQAISQKADLIMLNSGVEPTLVVPQLKAAKKAGIPILVNHLYQNGEQPPANVAPYIDATVTVPFHESGKLNIDYAVANGGCDGVKSTVILTSKEVSPSNGIVDAMNQELARLCPDAKATVLNIPAVDWGTKIAPAVQSALTADPNVKWVLPIYDSMSIPAIAGIRAAGKSNTVKVSSFNGTPDILTLIRNGDIMQADIGENVNWLGYADMDQALRILTKGEVIASGNEQDPLRLFDDSNVAEAGPPPSTGGFGNSYVDGYQKLWGIGG